MANTLLTIGMITREALMTLENTCVMAKHVNRQYDKSFGVSGAKIGNVVNARKPPRYVRTDGQALQLQDITETSVPVTLTTQGQRSFAVTSQELALDIDDFSKRIQKPAIINLANQVDYDVAQLFSQVNGEVGTPGTTPNALLTYLQAYAAMTNQAAPMDDRALVLTPQMMVTIVDSLKGLFQSSERIAEQYDTGNMGLAIGFKWSQDQNMPSFTVGLQGGTPVVSATAGQTGSSVTTSGWTDSTAILNQGDIVTFAGCYAVNPQNRQPYTGAAGNQLAQWVVTQNVVSANDGTATIPISGPGGLGIITAGPFQTCTASPTGGGAITVQGASGTQSSRGLAFHRDAFTLACADLPLYEGVHKAERIHDDQLGLSVRGLLAYDVNEDRLVCRHDFLYGVAVLYPELSIRIAS